MCSVLLHSWGDLILANNKGNKLTEKHEPPNYEAVWLLHKKPLHCLKHTGVLSLELLNYHFFNSHALLPLALTKSQYCSISVSSFPSLASQAPSQAPWTLSPETLKPKALNPNLQPSIPSLPLSIVLAAWNWSCLSFFNSLGFLDIMADRWWGYSRGIRFQDLGFSS